jgi:ferredoxin
MTQDAQDTHFAQQAAGVSAEAVDEGVYERLALHLGALAMGLPRNDVLIEVLEETLTPVEAEISLLLPTRVAPLQLVSVEEVAATTEMPREELATALEDMAQRRLLFSGTTTSGERGYALLQSGFGFGEQRFLWGGDESEYAAKMVEMLGRYFSRGVEKEQSACPTKPYRYIPLGESISCDLQAVFPYHTMEAVVHQAERFALAHCPCRMAAKIKGEACEHPIEVCLKFDELAAYLIERGLGREITREEALAVIKQSEEAGLVHFVDNAEGRVKHNCNCCGCSCWNVGAIRRRKIPRDDLMATYFMRTTDRETCGGCGACLDICPVLALTLEDGVAVLDEEWCIGCGLCVPRCSTGAAGLKLRTDLERVPPSDFCELHEQILREKGLAP